MRTKIASVPQGKGKNGDDKNPPQIVKELRYGTLTITRVTRSQKNIDTDSEDQITTGPATTMHVDAIPPTPTSGKRKKSMANRPQQSKRPRVLDEDVSDNEDVPIAQILLKKERKAVEEGKSARKKAATDAKGKARVEGGEEKSTKKQVTKAKQKVENVFVVESKIPKLGNKKGIQELRKDYTMLVCRTSPSIISTFVLSQTDFTANQRTALMEIGFERLLHWDIKDMPMRLGHYVCSRFHPLNSTIKLSDGRDIPVTDTDAYNYLGIPKGEVEIELPKALTNERFLKKLKADFEGKDIRNLTASDILKKMTRYDGGIWFKRYFILLFVNTVVESYSSGKINLKILQLLENVDQIRNFNWSSFLYKALINCSVAWANKKQKTFNGSLLLLQLIYVDRLKWKGLNVHREFPIIKNWTTKMLRDREDEEILHGGFGNGFLLSRPTFKEPVEESASRGVNEAEQEELDVPTEPANVVQTDEQVKCFMEEYLREIEGMARSVRAVLMKKKQIPTQLKRNSVLQTVNNKAEKIINFKLSTTNLDEESEEQPTQDTEFWDLAVTCMDEVEKTLAEHKEHSGNMFIPGFSDLIHTITKEHAVQEDEVARMDVDEEAVVSDKVDAGEVVREDIEKNVARGVDVEDIVYKRNEDKDKNDKDTQQGGTRGMRIEIPSFDLGLTPTPVELEQQLDDPVVEGVIDEVVVEEVAVVDEVFHKEDKEDDKEVENKGDKEKGDKEKEGSEKEVGEAVEQQDVDQAGQKDQESKEDQIASKEGSKEIDNITKQQLQEDNVNKQPKKVKFVCSFEPKGIADATPAEKRNTFPSGSTISPFKEREVNISERITPDEKTIYTWITVEGGGEKEDVFRLADTTLKKRDLITLAENAEIDSLLIDAFTVMLNENETYRGRLSPLRFFLPSFTMTLASEDNLYSVEEKCGLFTDSLLETFAAVKGFKNKKLTIKNVDVFFYPIISHGHYYLIAINVKNPSFHIIDNSSSGDDDKYGKVPSTLRNLMVNFLLDHDMEAKAKAIQDITNVPCERLQMKWRNAKNKVDCGVFLLRHMETYMGNGLSSWNPKMHTADKRQLAKLRIKYCYALLTSEFNERKARVEEIIQEKKAEYVAAGRGRGRGRDRGKTNV